MNCIFWILFVISIEVKGCFFVVLVLFIFLVFGFEEVSLRVKEV